MKKRKHQKQENAGQPPTRSEVRWAWVRLVLGLGQMGGAIFSFCLLLQFGLSEITVASVLGTTLCTTLSVLLFGAKKRKKP